MLLRHTNDTMQLCHRDAPKGNVEMSRCMSFDLYIRGIFDNKNYWPGFSST